MGWADEGLDLHLLPGLASDPLKPRMSFWETTGRSSSPPAAVSSILEFIPNFKRTRVGNEWRGPGVTVDAKTGVATATPPPATGPRLRNFLVHPVAGSV